MRFLITGDWHITEHAPERRLDSNYFETVLGKLRFITRQAREHGCRYILQPGDFFNHFRVSDYVKGGVYSVLQTESVPVLAVPGQHDMRYHNDKIGNTPLGLLGVTPVVTLLAGGEPMQAPSDYPIHFYGAGFGADVPDVKDPGAFNILLTHRMVINKKLWHGQEDAISGNLFIKKNPQFDMVVAGDNHTSFRAKYEGRLLFNCGSLLRTAVSQREHHPVIYIVDVREGVAPVVTPVKIPIEKDVFDLANYEEEKAHDEEINTFLSSLGQPHAGASFDYKKNIQIYLEENAAAVGGTVAGLINEIMLESIEGGAGNEE